MSNNNLKVKVLDQSFLYRDMSPQSQELYHTASELINDCVLAMTNQLGEVPADNKLVARSLITIAMKLCVDNMSFESKVQKFDNISEENKKLLNQISLLRDKNNELNDLINNHQQQLDDAINIKQLEIQNLDDSISNKNNEIQNLDNIIADKVNSSKNLDNDIIRKNKENQDLDNNIASKKLELEKLKEEFQKYQNSINQINNAIDMVVN